MKDNLIFQAAEEAIDEIMKEAAIPAAVKLGPDAVKMFKGVKDYFWAKPKSLPRSPVSQPGKTFKIETPTSRSTLRERSLTSRSKADSVAREQLNKTKQTMGESTRRDMWTTRGLRIGTGAAVGSVGLGAYQGLTNKNASEVLSMDKTAGNGLSDNLLDKVKDKPDKDVKKWALGGASIAAGSNKLRELRRKNLDLESLEVTKKASDADFKSILNPADTDIKKLLRSSYLHSLDTVNKQRAAQGMDPIPNTPHLYEEYLNYLFRNNPAVIPNYQDPKQRYRRQLDSPRAREMGRIVGKEHASKGAVSGGTLGAGLGGVIGGLSAAARKGRIPRGGLIGAGIGSLLGAASGGGLGYAEGSAKGRRVGAWQRSENNINRIENILSAYQSNPSPIKTASSMLNEFEELLKTASPEEVENIASLVLAGLEKEAATPLAFAGKGYTAAKGAVTRLKSGRASKKDLQHRRDVGRSGGEVLETPVTPPKGAPEVPVHQPAPMGVGDKVRGAFGLPRKNVPSADVRTVPPAQQAQGTATKASTPAQAAPTNSVPAQAEKAPQGKGRLRNKVLGGAVIGATGAAGGAVAGSAATASAIPVQPQTPRPVVNQPLPVNQYPYYA